MAGKDKTELNKLNEDELTLVSGRQLISNKLSQRKY
jgi:hypothetical protein